MALVVDLASLTFVFIVPSITPLLESMASQRLNTCFVAVMNYVLHSTIGENVLSTIQDELPCVADPLPMPILCFALILIQ